MTQRLLPQVLTYLAFKVNTQAQWRVTLASWLLILLLHFQQSVFLDLLINTWFISQICYIYLWQPGFSWVFLYKFKDLKSFIYRYFSQQNFNEMFLYKIMAEKCVYVATIRKISKKIHFQNLYVCLHIVFLSFDFNVAFHIYCEALSL